MEKIRVYELAKNINKDSKEVIMVLKSLGITVKNHMSTVSVEEGERIKKYFLDNKDGKNSAIKSHQVSDSKRKEKTSLQTQDDENSQYREGMGGFDRNKGIEKKVLKEMSTNLNSERLEKQNRKNYKNKKGKKNKISQVKEKREFAEVHHHVVMDQIISVQELSHQLGKKATEVILKLMSLGIMATINQEVDADTATLIAEEFGATIEVRATKEENLLNETYNL